MKTQLLKYKKIGKGYLYENGVGLNETSHTILKYYSEGLTVDEIANEIIEKHSIGSEYFQNIKKDIEECLEDLKNVQLIEK